MSPAEGLFKVVPVGMRAAFVFVFAWFSNCAERRVATKFRMENGHFVAKAAGFSGS